MGIPQISGVISVVSTVEPGGPGSSGVGVKFGEEFCQEGGVLGVDGENAQPATVFWGTDVIPGNFAVSTMASFFASPEEITPTLVDILDNPSGEEPSGHGVSKHVRENGIYKDQMATNGQTPASPPRKAHVTFLNDGGKFGGSKLIGREGKPKVGLGKGGEDAPKGMGNGEGCGLVGLDGNEGAFV
jgi:hypothetical protein